MPEHIAIIMDGNGRWAGRQGKPRLFGHEAGVKALETVVQTCSDEGVKYLTVYAFSTENWKRPMEEVKGIFQLLVIYLQKKIDGLQKNNVRITLTGSMDEIPDKAAKSMKDAIRKTADNTGLTLNVALNYGGRREIVDAVREMLRSMKGSEITESDLEQISEASLSDHLYTAGMPDPDLIIRTGGEQRLSNFLLWQSAYSELIFTDVFWPDFGREELMDCISEFHRRTRRFGGLTS